MDSVLSYHSSSKDELSESLEESLHVPSKDGGGDAYSEDFEADQDHDTASSKSSIFSSRTSSTDGRASRRETSGNRSPVTKANDFSHQTREVDGDKGMRHASSKGSSSASSRGSSSASKSSDGLIISKRYSLEQKQQTQTMDERQSRLSSSTVSVHSSVSVESNSARVMEERVIKMMQKSEKQKVSSDKKRRQRKAAAGVAPRSPMSEGRFQPAAPPPNNEELVVRTREELYELLAKNDELRIELLSSGRSEWHASCPRREVMNVSGTSSTRCQQKKAIETVTQSLRREYARHDLRAERDGLVAQRNELRRKLAKLKRLHSYFARIEKCNDEIMSLTKEKRALSLVIRRNEKLLLNCEEDQDTSMRHKRLAEEIKADAVLTQRSLEKAQRDLAETMKLRRDAQQRVQKLKEQKAELEREQGEKQLQRTQTDPEIRTLQEEYVAKSQYILKLKKQLRELQAPTQRKKQGGGTARKHKATIRERERLIESIEQMRAEVAVLSARSARRASSRRGSTRTKDKSGDIEDSPAVHDTHTLATRRHSSSLNKTPDAGNEEHVNKGDVEGSSTASRLSRGSHSSDQRLSTPHDGSRRDSETGRMEDLKRRLETKRERNSNAQQQEQGNAQKQEEKRVGSCASSLSSKNYTMTPSRNVSVDGVAPSHDKYEELNSVNAPNSSVGPTDDVERKEQKTSEGSTSLPWLAADDSNNTDTKNDAEAVSTGTTPAPSHDTSIKRKSQGEGGAVNLNHNLEFFNGEGGAVENTLVNEHHQSEEEGNEEHGLLQLNTSDGTPSKAYHVDSDVQNEGGSQYEAEVSDIAMEDDVLTEEEEEEDDEECKKAMNDYTANDEKAAVSSEKAQALAEEDKPSWLDFD